MIGIFVSTRGRPTSPQSCLGACPQLKLQAVSHGKRGTSMDSGLKVTDQQQEISFSDIVSGDNVINIPLFQRAYRWSAPNLKELWDDIDDIIEEKSKSQFLGVLVLVSQTGKIGRPDVFDVVDGQQRLSTCYLIILGLAFVSAKNGNGVWASEVITKFLLLRPFSDNPYNTKLVPAAADRQQFKSLWDKTRALPALSAPGLFGANPPSPPAPAGLPTGNMTKQFDRILRRLNEVYRDEKQGGLERILEILVSTLSFVQISLRDPTAAPKIFERLNARGEKITTGDLVRNEIFARVPNDPGMAQAIFSNNWQPFEAQFHDKHIDLERYLFPYGLVIDSQITKAELFSTLRKRWDGLPSPQAIIEDLARYYPEFVALEAGTLDPVWGKRLRIQMRRLHEMGAPSSVYPFVFGLFEAMRRGEGDEDQICDALELVEGFLFRRAICGYEPTGLHAVFKGLWKESSGKGFPSQKAISAAISARTTVPWPNDIEFAANIAAGNLYDRNIKKFALLEYERSAKGESPADDFEIEHILPQTPSAHWEGVFGDQYNELVNTWANLIPITRNMNPAVGQQEFASKKNLYKDSIFATTRSIGQSWPEWTPDAVRSRAAALQDWAIGRWPYRKLD